MYLLIDPTEHRQNHLVLFDDKKRIEQIYTGVNVDLLKSINIFLKKENISIENLQGVAVVTGKGGFTAIRVATVVANALVYIYKMPCITISKSESAKTKKIIQKIQRKKKVVFVAAQYSSIPNIKKSLFWKKILKK